MSSYENQDELYSRPVRAGKRTYFFDVKATRGKDLYMTITESKRRFDDPAIRATPSTKFSCTAKTLTSSKMDFWTPSTKSKS